MTKAKGAAARQSQRNVQSLMSDFRISPAQPMEISGGFRRRHVTSVLIRPQGAPGGGRWRRVVVLLAWSVVKADSLWIQADNRRYSKGILAGSVAYPQCHHVNVDQAWRLQP